MALLLVPAAFALLYVMLWRPQQQRVRHQRDLVNAVSIGDHVVTAGGMVARVVDTTDERVQLEIADGVMVEFLRLAVSRRLDPSDLAFGTIGAETTDDEATEAGVDDEDEAEASEEYEDEPEDGEAASDESGPQAEDEAVTNEEPAPGPGPDALAAADGATDTAVPTSEQDPH